MSTVPLRRSWAWWLFSDLKGHSDASSKLTITQLSLILCAGCRLHTFIRLQQLHSFSFKSVNHQWVVDVCCRHRVQIPSDIDQSGGVLQCWVMSVLPVCGHVCCSYLQANNIAKAASWNNRFCSNGCFPQFLLNQSHEPDMLNYNSFRVGSSGAKATSIGIPKAFTLHK